MNKKIRTTVLSKIFAVAAFSYGMAARADGLIVPFYIDPTTSAYIGRYSDPITGVLINAGQLNPLGLSLWNIAAAGADAVKNNTSSKYKDFWVIANGPANGPYSLPINPIVTAAFDNVRAKNGKIFGYIHTLQQPSSSHFISLSTVKGYVNAWVTFYPKLDGIFIDEFTPRAEVDGTNPASYRPTNPKPVNGQINPAGGYYYQLIKWIKQTYPQLRVITNPGGRVWSNQYLWNNLGDVVCSYENALSHAQGNQEWYAPKVPWGNLVPETTITTNPQCALIHSNATDLAGAINQAISHGYKYFYTAEASVNDNTWGIMPSYFTSEVGGMYVSMFKFSTFSSSRSITYNTSNETFPEFLGTK